jgi:CheY-like chemotaxis protein/anti-sigma regulatory factor (Ser/Thr protein kinase)
MELFLERFDADALIETVVNTIRPIAAKNNNELRIVNKRRIGAMLSDQTKLRQCLLNLLSNAAKFTENGNITVEVDRLRQEATDRVRMRVSDTGIGIPADKLPGLFEPFSQVDKSRTRKYFGTGLGLAITQRFARMMGGDLSVASEPGKGSTFTLEVPTQVEDDTAAPFEPFTPQANTVLVVDDDPAARDLLERFLQKEGFNTASAENGVQALKLVREIRPVAVTLDVMMPGMDGWTVLSSIKADPETATTPVIIVSVVDDKNLGYSLGAAEYLNKPIDREHLSRVLDRFRRVRGDCPVLVVEDDEAVRGTLRSVLKKHGWRVSEAPDGVSALELMRQEKPELILLDLIMPYMDGFEFLEELRRNEQWHSIPVIVITSKELDSDDLKRLNGSVAKIFAKHSYSYADLLQTLHRVRRRSPGAFAS